MGYGKVLLLYSVSSMFVVLHDLPFCVILALNSADFGFLLSVKCLAGVAWFVMILVRAVRFKYKHSPGIRFAFGGF